MLKGIFQKLLGGPLHHQEAPQLLQHHHHLWWDTHNASVDQPNTWIVGSREITLEKTSAFWTLSTFLQNEKKESFQHFQIPSGGKSLHFSPTLADRSLIFSLEKPQWLLQGHPVVLYVLSPIWLRIGLKPPGYSHERLCELSSQSVRLCWSGITTLVGDICYAIPLDIHSDPPAHWDLWQVMTPVTLINKDKTPVLVKEFLLPHPFSNLCLKPNGQLYTFGIHYHYQADTVDLLLNVEGAAKTDQVLGPRHDSAHQLSVYRLVDSMQPL